MWFGASCTLVKSRVGDSIDPDYLSNIAEVTDD